MRPGYPIRALLARLEQRNEEVFLTVLLSRRVNETGPRVET